MKSNPSAVEIVVEYDRPDGRQRQIGRFDQNHIAVIGNIFHQAVQAEASRFLLSTNEHCVEAAFKNAIFRNRLVSVDRAFPLLGDAGIASWSNLVVGLRRRRKSGGPDTPAETSSLKRLRLNVLAEILRNGCEPEAMVHHRHGPWEILFSHAAGPLTRPTVDSLLDKLERRCREPNVVLDTGRRNPSAMIRLPLKGQLYVAF